MDDIIKQIVDVIITWGPGGVLALIATGWGLSERADRKDAQEKLEKALTDWKQDTQQQSEKLTALVEKTALLVTERRGSR